MSAWNPATVKTQLRLTAQRLGQLQEKKDSQGTITRRDIATLLQQDDIGLARAKAQNLIQEDILGDLLEVLEMHVGLILEHFSEIDRSITPSPVLVEAASSIIFASPHTPSRDLNIVREILIQRLGPDFARSAMNNHDNYVSLRVLQVLSVPPPSAAHINDYLANIAATYGVNWTPELGRQDILNNLSELLDEETSPIVDLTRLRKLCAQGIPDNPPWLRPRIWKIFFGILPITKASWNSEIRSHRESYYNLVRRLLGPLSTLAPPTSPLESHDVFLSNASKQLYRIPPSFFSSLEDEPDIATNMCPLDDAAPDDIRIDCATNLYFRLRDIQEQDTKTSTSKMSPNRTPEIRIESDHSDTPEISLSTPEFPSTHRHVSTTLLPSKSYNPANAHQKHLSALLRLLYLHSSINPGSNSPHISSLLVPLYSVLLQEIDPQDLAHAEADAFWLFEAVVGEFSELEDEEGVSLWMRKFSERLAWADEELATNLHAKGLDPVLPHYSYRWLTPLLTQTLPLSSVLLVWDALFSRPMRDRESNPKIDYLLDICTGMLIRARTPLFRLGKTSRRSPGLWVEDNNDISSSSREPGDVFLEGMSLLQLYPIEAAGGIDRILQTASDLCQRWEEEVKAQKGDNLGLGARLKATMWKGFVGQMPTASTPEEEEEPHSVGNTFDDGNETETPQTVASLGITSRLAATVWRGITNQTAMEAPPSPPTPLSSLPASPPLSPSPTPPPSAITRSKDDSPQSSPASHGSSSIWSYAEKLKDSDTLATLAKVSTNWRAKAMMGRWSVGSGSTKISVPISPPEPTAKTRGNESRTEDGRRVSLPEGDRAGTYSPPERPAFFQSPRDSMFPEPRRTLVPSSPSSPEFSPKLDNGFSSRTHNIRASLVSLPNPLPTTKSVPRPLLLNSSSLITAPSSSLSSSSDPRSSRSNPASDGGQWADVLRAKGRSMHKTSQSSLSSLSPSDALGRPPNWGNYSERDSDSGVPSRVVPLNRRSVSPMAPGFRLPARRPTSTSSSGTSPERSLPSPITSSRHSPSNTISSPLALYPVDINSFHGDNEQQRSTGISASTPLELPIRKVLRKRTPPSLQSEADDTSDPSLAHAPPKIVRSRRYPPNITTRTRESSRSGIMTEQKTFSTNSLAPEGHQDHDIATTPKAATFDQPLNPSLRSPRRLRKYSGEDFESKPRKNPQDGNEVRLRKTLTDVPLRTRKVSGEDREEARSTRENAAIEGDDEGYDDLLSAYESEESATTSVLQ